MNKKEIALSVAVVTLTIALVIQFSGNVLMTGQTNPLSAPSQQQRQLSNSTSPHSNNINSISNTPLNTIALAQQNSSSNQTANSSSAISANSIVQQSATLTEVFKRVQNSVVQITSIVKDQNIIINGNSPTQTRLGSGFIYDKQGYIITNNHVVEGSTTVDVTFVDGNTYAAKVVGTDSYSDLAVLQITDDFGDETLVPLTLANSLKLEVGQPVMAIGNPFGLSDSLTNGVVSQTGRLLPNGNIGFSIPDVIQTNAAINPGNSGGPLLDMNGQVVGINTAISSNTGEFSGVGFAIPSDAVKRIVPNLIKNGSYSHPWLGIVGTNLTPHLIKNLGLSKHFKGVLVITVAQGGPAEKAGLHNAVTQQTDVGENITAGDIITAIDGQPIKRIEDVIGYIEDHKVVGDNVKLTVSRNGQITMDLNATLQARPSALLQQQSTSQNP